MAVQWYSGHITGLQKENTQLRKCCTSAAFSHGLHYLRDTSRPHKKDVAVPQPQEMDGRRPVGMQPRRVPNNTSAAYAFPCVAAASMHDTHSRSQHGSRKVGGGGSIYLLPWPPVHVTAERYAAGSRIRVPMDACTSVGSLCSISTVRSRCTPL